MNHGRSRRAPGRPRTALAYIALAAETAYHWRMASAERAPRGFSPAVAAPTARLASPAARLSSLDQLRGLVIVVMALDHVRDFFHSAAYQGQNPLDVEHTSAVLYVTRWVTHLCAPTFVFLAGTAAFLRGHRGGVATRADTAALSWFLVTRGAWLIVLELTYVGWLGWLMSFEPRLYNLQVLWALGASMMVLAALVWLPHWLIAVLGAAIVGLHNLTDRWDAVDVGALEPLWRALHARGELVTDPVVINVSYPLLPWLGVMLLGYAFGPIAAAPAELRRRWLLRLGLGALAAFAVLRGLNLYGNPTPWPPEADALRSLGAMLNVQKYPPSLAYVLATLGCALVIWCWLDARPPRWLGWLSAFGAVPMFVYLIHLPLIHGLSALLHQIVRGDGGWLVGARYLANGLGRIGGRVAHFAGWPAAPGFDLIVVYAVWIGVIVALYPLARWFAGVKQRHRSWWWLSYL